MVLASPGPLLTPPPSSSPPKTPFRSYSAITLPRYGNPTPPPPGGSCSSRRGRCVRRTLTAIVDGDEESEQDCRISEQCGGRTRGKSCGINSGSRVASTVERAVRVCMPLGSIEPVRVQGVVGHRGRRRAERTGRVASACAGHYRPSWTATSRSSTTAASASSAGTAPGGTETPAASVPRRKTQNGLGAEGATRDVFVYS
jgi:hypothetical protein